MLLSKAAKSRSTSSRNSWRRVEGGLEVDGRASEVGWGVEASAEEGVEGFSGLGEGEKRGEGSTRRRLVSLRKGFSSTFRTRVLWRASGEG